MKGTEYKRTKIACYMAYFTMSSVFCVPPLLFVAFRNLYGISYTLLGTLVLINFVTQLGIDIIFTAFSKHFNTKIIVRIMPLITAAGLLVYALLPNLFPDIAYLGLVIGTVIFSVSAGLSEVLLSPVIAAIPSDNPGRDMSALHSLYAFGTFTMIVISSVFLKVFGSENWMFLFIFLACLPVIPSVLFFVSPMPEMNKDNPVNSDIRDTKRRAVGLVLCLCCIFLGSCAENAMTSWISTYMERAIGISKVIGDILGAAMFAVLLGMARLSYAKFGKNISKVVLISMIGAAVCYLVVGLSPSAAVAFIACILTGIFVAMLWPGTLMMMEEKMPGVGIAAYALMAAGGDLGASVSPQLMGIIVDNVSATDFAVNLGNTLNISSEQVGLKTGMLVTSLFPLIGIIVVICIIRYFKKTNTEAVKS